MIYGPPSIEPDQKPDGLVFHVYSESGELLVVRKLGPDQITQVRRIAIEDCGFAMFVSGSNRLATVVYDGDTGQRSVTMFTPTGIVFHDAV